MKIVNMHEAKTNLSKLVARAVAGESFVIARSGKPLVKVVPLDHKDGGQTSRIGFLEGRISVPEDFDRIGEEEIRTLFGDGP